MSVPVANILVYRRDSAYKATLLEDFVQRTVFPAGEMLISVADNAPLLVGPGVARSLTVELRYYGDQDFMAVAQLTDVLRQLNPDIELHLLAHYLPHSRMDRKVADTVCFSLRTAMRLLEVCGFKTITTHDVHSPVAEALCDRLYNVPQEVGFFDTFGEEVTCDAIVAPDAGAAKKIYDVAKKCGVKEVLVANKVRDVMTGDILRTEIQDRPLPGAKKFYIIDDICDGGRTFIELAKVLRKQYGQDIEITLHTTHGIYSKGKAPLLEVIDHVYCAFNRQEYVS